MRKKYSKLSTAKNKKRNSTNPVDICSMSDQGGCNVLTEDPSGHMQGRHPVAIHSVDVGTIVGKNVDSRQSAIAY